MDKTFTPETSLRISRENPQAAGNFLKYMHAVEPQIIAAQEKFAGEINRAMQAAAKAFIEGEGLNMSAEDQKAMTANCVQICESMCRSGDAMVKRQFAEMSQSMAAAAKK